MKIAIALVVVVALPLIGWAQCAGGSARNYNQGINPGVGSGTDPCNWNSAALTEVDALGISYTATIGDALTSPSTVPTVSCESGTGYLPNQKAQLKPASALALDSCPLLFASADNSHRGFLWRQAYDTAKKYIESCPNYYQSWRAFEQILSPAAQGLYGAHDSSIYTQYRSWLESVLYLNNTDPEYFCVCVEAIAQTFSSVTDTTEELGWKATNKSLAVFKWLLDHTSCDTGMLRREYQGGRDAQHEDWIDDTTKILDTTLPSMHDLGLDSLLNLHLGVGLSKSPYAGILSSFTISKNPFTATTTLHFDLDRMVYMRVEVYDELGRVVTGDGSGYSYEPGKHQIPIDLKGFSSGAYYLRISLGDGEVRTIKMVKKD